MSKITEYVIILGAAQLAKDDAQHIIADAGGYTLLKGPGAEADFGTANFAYLSKEEAADCLLSHLFTDYTSMTPEDRITLVAPMIERDAEILYRVRRDALGYFYCKDQTAIERGVALTRYSDALNMAMAGSVEGTAEQLALVTPDDQDEADFIVVMAARLSAYLLKFPR